MKTVLFSHSYFLRLDPKQWQAAQPYPPLGTLYAAALLREMGHTVSLFDTQFATGPAAILTDLDRHPDIFVLYDDGFNYLTKMCLTNMREAAFEMIRQAHQRNCIVIVCSSDSTDHYEQYLQQGADFVILGEGEQTLAELVTALDNGERNFLSIQGIAYRLNNAVVKTPKRPVIKELDALPLPAWDLIRMEDYRRIWIKNHGYFSLNMATTRGCPFKCNWCAKPIYGNRYNSRSPQHVVRELRLLKEKYQVDHIWFCDDIFGLRPGWVKSYATELEQVSLKVPFKIQARADLLVQENYVHDLARAGCVNVWMGAESGSQEILDAMDKGTTVMQIREATRLLKKYQIRPSFFIQFGYPGETRDDIRKTIRMITELLPSEIGISVSYPLPGTAFFEKVKNDLRDKANWTDSDELALMFRNTYGPAFYKQLHRYVHKAHRKGLALQTMKSLIHRPQALRPRLLKKAASWLYYAPAAWIHKQKLAALENLAI